MMRKNQNLSSTFKDGHELPSEQSTQKSKQRVQHFYHENDKRTLQEPALGTATTNEYASAHVPHQSATISGMPWAAIGKAANKHQFLHLYY